MLRRTTSAVAVVAVTTALLGAGVFRAWADSGPVSSRDASTDADPIGALDWQPCADATTSDCANLPVPIDWYHPHDASVDLAVVRHKAPDPTRRIGTLVLNPGGPGGSGVDYIEQSSSTFSPDLLARFDVVSWDPRGVGRSHPVQVRLGPAEQPGVTVPGDTG